MQKPAALTLSPAFCRWLIQKYLFAEFFNLFGMEGGYRRIAAKIMRGQWYHHSLNNPVEKRMVLFVSSEETCMEAALAEWQYEESLKQPNRSAA